MTSRKRNAGKAGASVDRAGGPDSTNKKVHVDSSTDAEILSNKSTTTAVQLRKLLALLRNGPKTTMDLRKHGIMMPAARVFQLKNELNYTISTELLELYDTEGIRHRKCARYHLVGEPCGAGHMPLDPAPRNRVPA